ncbi:MAG: hypothetical protein A3J62_04120 [Candidatus Buchananbacteria bacterium RIFCSPHIGHO2_02_FULL_38_8]|uniref:HTH luxR-type domain-containing protein n=2 Tax=Candidatus Buchananiibacteriota TaxID=1817903 RepID=A0A1G1XXN8_9BACT|nr:hypothetical protein [uncultured bacterium]OGY44356.1 MAG: hypothetical protein A2731_00105 [Candidatus Buchananbacteria bacterium RIFCSPHIGHO2_01_FULL_39_8]OGY47189.1 MAG: hypothetical protein A3J62_04120 [Candidatus Buchananbacteria bacterium RIFCSPHIGHO2_02_FULL_38_8]
MENNESQTIARIKGGELDQFGRLYDLYIKKIYNFIYYKTLHKETAEDLTSQTFFKALKNIKSFDEAKGSFSSWIYRIARNTVIDYHRTKRTEANIDDIWDLSSDSNIETDINTIQKLDTVKKYLQKFKPQQREIVIMRLWDQLSYQEIAEITGLTVANCKMTFSRVITKLREEMSFVIFYILLITKQILWLIK